MRTGGYSTERRKHQGAHGSAHVMGSERLRHAVPAILIVAVTLTVALVHRPVLTAPILGFDDALYIKDNDLVPNPGWASVRRVFAEVLSPTVPGYYEPLSMLSLMGDYAMGGRADNLRPFHRTSLALHLLVTAQIVGLTYLLFRNPWTAALTGLLFSLHPMTIEPIALVSQRKTLLAAFFAWFSLIFYVTYARTGRRWAYIGSLAAFLLAVLAKPTSIPLPLLLIVMDYWPLRRLTWRTLQEKVPFLIIAAVFAVITIIATKRTGGIQFPSEQAVSPAAAILKICYLNLFYLWKILWPANLCLLYPLPDPLSFSQPLIRYAALGTVLFMAGILLSIRRTRALAAGWLAFSVAIFPSFGALSYTWVPAADKYVYLPAIGLLLVVAWLLESVRRRTNTPPLRLLRATAILAVLAVAACEARATRRHLDLWQNSLRFHQTMVERAPNSAQLRNCLGLALVEAGRPEDAKAQYLECLRLNPSSLEARSNLAMILGKQGLTDQALTHYRKVLELKPDYAPARIGLGNILAGQGKYPDAIAQYEETLRNNPLNADAHYNMGVLLARLGRPDDAATHLDIARRQLQRDPSICYALAGIMTQKGDLESAIRLCKEAIRFRPDIAEYHFSLGTILLQQGRNDEAVQHLADALRLHPDHPQARINLNLAKRRQSSSAPDATGLERH